MKFTYLIINLFSIFLPVLYSRDKRMSFYKKWPAFIVSNIIIGIIFIIWDIIFTKHGIWGFNPKYLSGIYFFGLPLGEWLFFFCIPYACIFTHESLKYFLPKLSMKESFRNIYLIMGIVCLLLVTKYSDRAYTLVTNIIMLGFVLFLWLRASKTLLERIFISYITILLPFLLVNGLLTGSWIPEQIVWYNDLENMGIRVGTIPMDDFFYCFILIGGNIALYEYFLKVFGIPKSVF